MSLNGKQGKENELENELAFLFKRMEEFSSSRIKVTKILKNLKPASKFANLLIYLERI